PIRNALTKAARETFRFLRERHPDEQFYAYALHMDDDEGHGLSPAANSVQSFDRILKRYAMKKEKVDLAHLRYCPDEWTYLSVQGSDDTWRAVWKLNDALVTTPSVSIAERR